MHNQHIARIVQDVQASSGPKKLFINLSELHWTNSQRNQGVVIFQDDVPVYGTTKDQFQKRMLAVKSRLREKNFTINEKKSNSTPDSSVSFSGYSVSKEGIAPNPKHVEKIKKQNRHRIWNNSSPLSAQQTFMVEWYRILQQKCYP